MKALTQVRNDRGWSQQRLADESGVNKATINQIERGRRSPNVETLEKLAAALEAEVADFFPKAQGRLPFEEASPAEQRRSPFVESWTSYLLERAREWEEEIPEEGEDLFGNLERTVEILRLNEQVQVETAMLFKALLQATRTTLLIENGAVMALRFPSFYRDLARLFDKRADIREASDAANRMASVAGRWRARAEVAGDVVAAQIGLEQFENAKRARERGERAFKEHHDAGELFRELQSA